MMNLQYVTLEIITGERKYQCSKRAKMREYCLRWFGYLSKCSDQQVSQIDLDLHGELSQDTVFPNPCGVSWMEAKDPIRMYKIVVNL